MNSNSKNITFSKVKSISCRKVKSIKSKFCIFLRHLSIPVTANDFRLRLYKGRYPNKRCFIVGSGPSMKIEYLERLKHEYTFSANQIFRCFGSTAWRPNFYVIGDSNIGEIHKTSILGSDMKRIFVSSHMAPILNNDSRIIYFNKTHEDYTDSPPLFSSNCLERVEGGYTVSYLAMQLAWYMGFREIYTIGIDAKYSSIIKQVVAESGDYTLVKSDSTESYFLPSMIQPDEPTYIPLPDRQILAYQSTKEYIETHGGVIYNAAPESPLEVFKRVEFDSLF